MIDIETCTFLHVAEEMRMYMVLELIKEVYFYTLVLMVVVAIFLK